VHLGARAIGRVRDGAGEELADRVGERHMTDDAVLEERRDAPLGEIDELVRHDEVTRLDLLLHRADRADAHEVRRPRLLQRADVRAVVDLMRRDPVAAAVARQEEERRPARERALHEHVARAPERRVDLDLRHVAEALHLVESAAAEDAQCVAHGTFT
jgi:hypothetical protein